MSLIVEDGTGLATAETYISVADAVTYHAARGNTAWAALATDALREQALRRAADYMTQAYRLRWKGNRKTTTQALDWPRSWVYLQPVTTPGIGDYPYLVSDTSVPVDVARACAELALRAAALGTTPMLADTGQTVTSEKVGPLEVHYGEFSPATTRYSAIDAAMAPYLTANGGAQVLRG